MALNSIETIKNAELDASKQIADADKLAKQNLSDAKIKAEKIISAASDDVKIQLEHKADVAKAKADEIIVSACNSAKLEAEKLRKDAMDKQESVNNAIFQIIV